MKGIKFFSLLLCALFLTGCWDQNNLKDVKLVMGTAFDLTTDNKILNTVAIPNFTAVNEGTKTIESQIVSSIGDTPRDTRDNINHKISEDYDASKLMVILFGEEYAKQDIKSTMDVFYRDPKSSHTASLVVVKGRASDALKLKILEKKPIHQYLADLLLFMQEYTVIPKRTTNPILSYLYNPGADFVLPLLEVKENEAEVIGTAMFNKNKYTGHDLTSQESTLFLLMSDKIQKKAWLKLKVHQNRKPDSNNYILINVLNLKRDLNVKANSADDISVNINLDLKVEVMEYPADSLDSEKEIKDLNIKISQLLTSEVNNVIKKMKEANSDILGIDSQIMAFYPDTWDKINWDDKYSNLNIKSKVSVEIFKHGVSN